MTTQPRTRQNRGDRHHMYLQYMEQLMYCKSHGLKDPNKADFIRTYNAKFRQGKAECKRHAFDNILKTVWEDDITFNRYAMNVSSTTSLTGLVRQYVVTSNNLKDNKDCRNTPQWITNIATMIDDQLRLQPSLIEGYEPRTITNKYGPQFIAKNPEIIHNTLPSPTRAEELTGILGTLQTTHHPELCQTLQVRYKPDINGYGLYTTAPIPRYSIIDTYRGVNTKHTITPLLTDTEYIFASDTEYVNAAHPESCFARYANENLDGADNARFSDEDDNDARVLIIATQDIPADSEITVTYGPDYWYAFTRIHLLPPDTHNKVIATYGHHFRHLKTKHPVGYVQPGLDHQPKCHHPHYNENTTPRPAKGPLTMTYFDDLAIAGAEDTDDSDSDYA